MDVSNKTIPVSSSNYLSSSSSSSLNMDCYKIIRFSTPLARLVPGSSPAAGVLINHLQVAGYKKRNTHPILHKPTFDEYDKLPGDPYQTVYVGYYDDKRHTNPQCIDRFYRLNWGGWIRARGGRGRRWWAKTGPQMWWSKQHILCNETQSMQLEKMFETKYRKKTFFVDDPYEQYEERDLEFLPKGHAPYNYSYVKARDYVD